MAKNIKLSYLYRDGANYKLFDFIIFRNDTETSIEEIAAQLKAQLIIDTYFEPEAWGIPRLSFEKYVPEFDHQLHEVESIERTDEAVTKNQDILEFIENINR